MDSFRTFTVVIFIVGVISGVALTGKRIPTKEWQVVGREVYERHPSQGYRICQIRVPSSRITGIGRCSNWYKPPSQPNYSEEWSRGDGYEVKAE